jgi:hypothetical protein
MVSSAGRRRRRAFSPDHKLIFNNNKLDAISLLVGDSHLFLPIFVTHKRLPVPQASLNELLL